MGRRGRPKIHVSPACPQPEHVGSFVCSDGTRQREKGLVRYYRCRPDGGETHRFTILEVPVPPIRWTPPPACPAHPDSHVILGNQYADSTRKPRQSYLCSPNWTAETAAEREVDKHTFTPLRPRDHVHDGQEHCGVCEETRTVHNGEQAAARRHTWDRRTVIRALEKLSEGMSYGKVSEWADAAGERRKERKVPSPVGPGEKRRNVKAQEARNRWHTAGDWVEVYAPILFKHVDTQLRNAALVERERLDLLKAAGKPLDRPQVILIDDVPVNARVKDPATGVLVTQRLYFILTVAEVHWVPDPWTEDGVRGELRLRLVRAFANNGHLAWKLLFDELGYTPDFVVADAGTGLKKAVTGFWPTARFIPSMWHVQDAIRGALIETKAASVKVDGQRQLRPELARHVSKLLGDGVRNLTPQTWTQWWDDLEALLVQLHLPTEKVKLRRRNYEKAVAARLPDLARWPFLPVATGGLETLQNTYIAPLLHRRKHRFSNIERTNSLFDLVVCRAHNLFTNEQFVLDLLHRELDTDAAYGWTAPLRAVTDQRSDTGPTTSLWDPSLITSLADEKKIS
jgi:hypothetical protein